LAEFTGERLIPGEVDSDLLNEHLARYAFAARLARGKRVLDAGCGAGYGSAELAQAAQSVIGVDIAPEAVEFARRNYQSENLSFELASGAALPHEDSSFDLVVAFEVIEHIENWLDFLKEARRVLAPTGQFIVSTPNKRYYTESRGPEGANPYHVHEFTFDEFRQELCAVFPHVLMFLENHTEGVLFQPIESGGTADVRVDTGDPKPDESHFIVAVCANKPQVGNPTFVYVPRSGNILRERERHIALLEAEIAQKDQWAAELQTVNRDMLATLDRQNADLKRSNQWAESLNKELEERRARIVQLQLELTNEQESARKVVAGYEAKIAELDQELEKRTEWAQSLQQVCDTARSSRWVKLGRKLGVGPAI
jgi:SAM-dependent methyltransferase